MNPRARRLTFTVGTSLLTASLSMGMAGCKKHTVNEGPEPPHTNEGPEPEANDSSDPDETVNEGPVAEPDTDGAEPDGPPPEEPHVNTVPDAS